MAASEAGQLANRDVSDPERYSHMKRFNMARGLRLDGTGFIVLNAREHGTLEEFDSLDAANEEACIQAGGVLAGGQGSGMAIVYAPVAVVRPNVPANMRVASSALMDQVMRSRAPAQIGTAPLTPPDSTHEPVNAE